MSMTSINQIKPADRGMEILSLGAGMQSTALHLMSCENALAAKRGKKFPWPLVPVYDISIYCDLGCEPPWVKKQFDFCREAGERCGVPVHIIQSPLYEDFMQNFGERRTISIPWWTQREDGHKSKMPRNCTIDYKVEIISHYVRWELLGYRKGQRLRDEDKKAHKMHMGFSCEEERRCKESPNPMFVNRYPLVDMGFRREESYAYILDKWGLDTKASACTFCPYHRNYFYWYLKNNLPEEYERLIGVDELLRDKNPKPPMDSDLFISRSRKRIADLTDEDCDDAEWFPYRGQMVWNGF